MTSVTTPTRDDEIAALRDQARRDSAEIKMMTAMVKHAHAALDEARAEVERLRDDLRQAHRERDERTEYAQIKALVDIRWAVGDNGKRMQDELVEYIKEIVAERDELRARKLDAQALIDACVPGGSICDPQAVADAIREYARLVVEA